MGVIAKEDIAAYSIDGQIICSECITTEQEQEVTEDDIITRQDIENNEEKIYFCDVCKEKL